MALLILWEVDHGCSFPSRAGGSQASRLTGFTRRLKEKVARDEELREWLTCKYMQMPLSPGLPTSHHSRWSVSLTPPPGGLGVGWYLTFTSRWKEYLRGLMEPAGSAEATSSSSNAGHPAAAGEASRIGRSASQERPSKRKRTTPATRGAAAAAAVAPLPSQQERPRQARPRAAGPAHEEPPQKRQATLGSWLQPLLPRPGAHGRAAEGPPT